VAAAAADIVAVAVVVAVETVAIVVAVTVVIAEIAVAAGTKPTIIFKRAAQVIGPLFLYINLVGTAVPCRPILIGDAKGLASLPKDR